MLTAGSAPSFSMDFPLLLLGAPPPKWPAGSDCAVLAAPSAPLLLPLEPAGPGFVAHARRRKHHRSLSEDERMRAAIEVTAGEDVSLDEDEEETDALLASDPLDWKTQDHYAVLGLGKLRWRATEDDIRKAYRRKVLKHHPDKKDDLSDDAFFKCVQKAWEVLSEPTKRLQWDSVDPTYDDAIPPAKLKPGADFFAVYNVVFERNGRWSKKHPVPLLGNLNSTREEVEEFYDFWLNFESWRTFEAYDEDDPEKAESREEKRWIERGNKAARLKLKKEDNARLIALVENAMRTDPRLQRFKDEEKQAKAAKKQEKEDAVRKAAEDKKKAEEEERLRKEELEKQDKLRAGEEKKEREARKNKLRKDRKALRDHAKANNYYLADGADQVSILEEAVRFDDLLDTLEGEQIEAYRARQTNDSLSREQLKEIYEEELERLRFSRDGEKKKQEQFKTDADTQRQSQEKTKGVAWSPKELAALIHAVKVHPGGTTQRWEKIAFYVNTHGGEDDEDEKAKKRRLRKADDCIRMSKELDEGQAVAMEKDRQKLQAVTSIKKHEVEIKDAPTMRYEADEELEREAVRAKEAAVSGKAAKPAEEAKQAPVVVKPVAKKPAAEDGNPKEAAAAAGEAKPARKLSAVTEPSAEAKPRKISEVKEKTAPRKLSETAEPKEPKADVTSPSEAVSAAVAAGATAVDNVWSPVQQAALEAALRTHSASMYKDAPNERWDKIAPLVPGKTKKDIKARVKELAELVKQKKQAA